MDMKSAKKFIDCQKHVISNHVYDKLLLAQKGKYHYELIGESTTDFIRSGNNVCMTTNMIEMLEQGIEKLVRLKTTGQLDGYGFQFGGLDPANTRFYNRLNEGLHKMLVKFIVD